MFTLFIIITLLILFPIVDLRRMSDAGREVFKTLPDGGKIVLHVFHRLHPALCTMFQYIEAIPQFTAIACSLLPVTLKHSIVLARARRTPAGIRQHGGLSICQLIF